ncbi:MAG: STAS/SEC14 domain-containing protein, partial [Blastocatellia bacterium]
IRKRQSYTITEAELQELRQLTDQIEKSDAERLKNLIELAHLRHVPLDDLIRQLGLKPYPHG